MTTVSDLFQEKPTKLPLKERLVKADKDINAMTEEILKMYNLQWAGGIRVMAFADTTEELNEEGRYNTRTHIDIGEDLSEKGEKIDATEVLKDVADYDIAGILQGMNAVEKTLKSIMAAKLMANKDVKKFSIDGDSGIDGIPEEAREGLQALLKKLTGDLGGLIDKPKKKKKDKPSNKKDDDDENDDDDDFIKKLKNL